jgi:hypothetical protein
LLLSGAKTVHFVPILSSRNSRTWDDDSLSPVQIGLKMKFSENAFAMRAEVPDQDYRTLSTRAGAADGKYRIVLDGPDRLSSSPHIKR